MQQRPLSLDAFRSDLGMLLRDFPRGTTAELTEDAIAYWNGHQVVFCFLRDDESGQIDEEFDFADFVWSEWQEAMAAWLASPIFACRSEVLDWLKDAPPRDCGAE